MQFRILVFPAPFGPMMANISSSLTSKLTPERAETPPKLNQMSLAFNLDEIFYPYKNGGLNAPHRIRLINSMSIEKIDSVYSIFLTILGCNVSK